MIRNKATKFKTIKGYFKDKKVNFREKSEEMAITQQNIVLFELFFYLFARADKGYIPEDIVLKE